jgi:hypothetical protein
VAGDPAGEEVYSDILDACERQRSFDPKMTWIVRKPDGAILKIRNGSTTGRRRI